MSTDDRSRGHRPEDETVTAGDGRRDVEAAVRRALTAEALQIRPHHRLDAILGEAHGDPELSGSPRDQAGTDRHRWLVAAAAAAVVAALVGGIWVANRPTTTRPPAASQTTSAVSRTPTSESPTSTSQGTSTPTTAQPVAPIPTSLPVYYVGPRTEGSTTLVLFREFTTAQVADPGDAAATANAALQRAVAGSPAGASYRPLWQGVRVDRVTVASGQIGVTLSTGAKGLDATEGQLAVQQLVWTAQAAVNEGNLPVRFALADDSTTLAGDLTTKQAYARPTGEAAAGLLSPVWISEPSRGQTLRAGTVTVSGVASTFEASVQWRISLRASSKVVASGHTTATASAPQRGTYEFTTSALPAGEYTVQVFETSAKDGSVTASATIPFTLS